MNKFRKTLALVIALIMVVTVAPAISYNSNVKAASSFEITSPKDNKLVAAGYIDIEWTAPTAGTVRDYQVYINGASVGTTNNTSFEYYTTKVQTFNVYVKANYTNNTSESTDEITFGVSKKGLGLATDMGRNLNLQDMGVAWYYNWGESPSSGSQYQGIEYVPMVWKETNANNFKRRVESAKSKGYKYILTFNEPDLQGQCDMPMNDVYNVWKGISGMEGINISSPVTALWPEASGNWFQPFMTKVDQNGDYMPDFISIHCYPDNFGGAGMASWFLEKVVDWTWNKYHLPIWITEFSTTGGSVTATGGNGTKEFWEAVMPGLDSREYVERYAAFGFNAANMSHCGLWNYNNGALTPGGEVYKALGNPAGFEAAVPDYTIKTESRNSLLSDSKVINGVTCEDYVNKNGVSATANSEIGANGAASLAIDDSFGTRWESRHGQDPGILTIDLGSVRNIKEVDIAWENASASQYTIEVSNDNQIWTPVAEVTGSGGRCDIVTLKNQATGRYVRINGTARSTDYGYSIYDLAIYGTTDTKVDETTAPPTTPSPTTPKPTTAKPLPTTYAVENETFVNNILTNSSWTTQVDSNKIKCNGKLTVNNGVINGTFATTGGGWGDAIYGIAAQAKNVSVEAGAEYTYSATIKANQDMKIRIKITDAATTNEQRVVYETITLKAGEIYQYTKTFTAPSNKVNIMWALGGGMEGATEDVSVAIYNNNFVKSGEGQTSQNPTTVNPNGSEPSGETTFDINSMKKPRKVTVKKVNKKVLSAKKVSLKIKKVKGATGYETAIYKTKKNANKNIKAIATADGAKIKIVVKSKKLKNKKKLFVRVRAYVTVGSGIKVPGKWSKVKKVKIKK